MMTVRAIGYSRSSGNFERTASLNIQTGPLSAFNAEYSHAELVMMLTARASGILGLTQQADQARGANRGPWRWPWGQGCVRYRA